MDIFIQMFQCRAECAFKSKFCSLFFLQSIVIPQNEGLTVRLRGNVRTEIGSPHYNAHNTLENFWSDYRANGKFAVTKPTVGEYNRAAYDSLVNAGISRRQAAHYIGQAYAQQRHYGLSNTSLVPNVPGSMHLRR